MWIIISISAIIITGIIVNIKSKSKKTIIETGTDCKSCPFRVKRGKSDYECGLDRIISNNTNSWYDNELEMKEYCNFKGKLKITIQNAK